MKSFALMAAALFLGFTLSIGDAEARRLGGGSSAGMQRQSIAPNKNYNSAPQRQNAAPASTAGTTPAAQPRRSWGGPLAGLAAGLGLAALASHFGLGEEFGSLMLIGLLIMGAVMVFGFFARRKAGAPNNLQYAGNGFGGQQQRAPEINPVLAGAAAQPVSTPAGNIPADFDAEAFIRHAKVNFIRLQAANDAANLDDIREFTSPEMFAEIKLGIDERGGGKQETDIVRLDAEILDVNEESSRYVVTVRFTGLIREEKDAPAAAFDEMWHLIKPRSGGGWVLAGIQQVQ